MSETLRPSVGPGGQPAVNRQRVLSKLLCQDRRFGVGKEAVALYPILLCQGLGAWWIWLGTCEEVSLVLARCGRVFYLQAAPVSLLVVLGGRRGAGGRNMSLLGEFPSELQAPSIRYLVLRVCAPPDVVCRPMISRRPLAGVRLRTSGEGLVGWGSSLWCGWPHG